jgi:hypothetical protein
MQIDRRIQSRRAFPERIVGAIVEIFSVRVSVDHRATKLQVAHATFKLISGGFRILHGKMSKTGIAVGAFGNFLGEKIV